MNNARKIGIGIVMIIPAFVGSGLAWHVFSKWLPVLIWLLLVILFYLKILTGKSISTRTWILIFIWFLFMEILLTKLFYSLAIISF